MPGRLLTLDFGALPPEVNSGRMYAGPGSAPLLAAAAAWDGLAAELEVTAAGYMSAVGDLTTTTWLGPTSAALAAAAGRHIAWMLATAAQAERTAAAAQQAGAAFETAFALTVPPPVIAANRATLSALITTNFFGQNTPGIAATEAQYAQMWAEDAAAMYGYAAASTRASANLQPFVAPPRATNPVEQTFAVAHTVGGVSAALRTALPGFETSLPQLPETAAASGAQGVPLFGLTPLLSLSPVFGVEGLLGPTLLGQNAFFLATAGFRANSQVNLGTRIQGIKQSVERRDAAAEKFPRHQAEKLGAGHEQAHRMSAAMGQAAAAGPLSVPVSWAREPAVFSPAAASSSTEFVTVAGTASPTLPESMSGSTFSQGLMAALSNESRDPVHPKTKPALVHNQSSERAGRSGTRS